MLDRFKQQHLINEMNKEPLQQHALKLLQAEQTVDVDQYSPHLYIMEIVLWGMENEIVIATKEQDQQRLRALVEELILRHPLVQMGYLMDQSYKNEDEMQEDEEYIMSLQTIDEVAELIIEDLIGILGRDPYK